MFDNKNFSSLHTHTNFCDGRDNIETMCRTAFEKGLSAIGFSSHAPIEKAGLKTDWHMDEKRLEEYKNEVLAARRRWKGKIDVYLGLELEYIKGLRTALDSDVKELGLDYIIGSIHYISSPNGTLFTIDGSKDEMDKIIMEDFKGCGEAVINAYWDALEEMIALGGFEIVGHLDLIKKNNVNNCWFNMESKTCMKRLEGIAQAIASAGLVVEANTGGITRGYFAETCPSPAFLSILNQYKAPVLITADAHNAGDIDGNYNIACQILQKAGYKSHILFAGRNKRGVNWIKQEFLS